jgi:hypothetical protein
LKVLQAEKARAALLLRGNAKPTNQQKKMEINKTARRK